MALEVNDNTVQIALLQERLKGVAQQLESHDLLMREMFKARDENREMARNSINKRLDIMNGFRETLVDQQSTFMPKDEYTVRHDALEGDVRRVEIAVQTTVTRIELEKAEDRLMRIEHRLANLDGRLWMLGTVIMAINVFLNWYWNGGFHMISPGK